MAGGAPWCGGERACNSNRCRWRGRFCSSRSSDPSPSRPERLLPEFTRKVKVAEWPKRRRRAWPPLRRRIASTGRRAPWRRTWSDPPAGSARPRCATSSQSCRRGRSLRRCRTCRPPRLPQHVEPAVGLGCERFAVVLAKTCSWEDDLIVCSSVDLTTSHQAILIQFVFYW